MQQSTRQYLEERPWAVLRRLQQQLHCRVVGDARTCAALRAAILAHVIQEGLSTSALMILLCHPDKQHTP